jgi:hypothetical protein
MSLGSGESAGIPTSHLETYYSPQGPLSKSIPTHRIPRFGVFSCPSGNVEGGRAFPVHIGTPKNGGNRTNWSLRGLPLLSISKGSLKNLSRNRVVDLEPT